jgi:hypothetical protein
MTIGTRTPAEWRTFTDPETGRIIRQLTSAPANNYPLYYFIPSITPDNRFLVFHSERSGWVQLHRLDLNTGENVQMSDGCTRDAGWAIWCQPRLRGIYNHLSSLNVVRNEVYYFQDEEVRSTHVETMENRIVHRMPGRIFIGQTGFSPDGRWFAFIHADREHFTTAIADREAIRNMGQPFDHEAWREGVPCVIGLLNTETGVHREVMRLDYHVHHVFFLDDLRLLVNHVRGENGMWSVDIDGRNQQTLRPRNGHGAICHQVITEQGIFYEANDWRDGQRTVWFGQYRLEDGAYHEMVLPDVGYVHTGRDPAGRFHFIENQGNEHALLAVEGFPDGDALTTRLLRRLPAIPAGQRYHAHPFLGPDRRWLYYTEVIDGFSQVCALELRPDEYT